MDTFFSIFFAFAPGKNIGSTWKVFETFSCSFWWPISLKNLSNEKSTTKWSVKTAWKGLIHNFQCKTESPIKWNKNISYLICLALPLLTIKKTFKKDVRLIWPPPLMIWFTFKKAFFSLNQLFPHGIGQNCSSPNLKLNLQNHFYHGSPRLAWLKWKYFSHDDLLILRQPKVN